MNCLTKDFLFFQAAYKSEKPLGGDDTEHRIRITLTSQNVPSLENGWCILSFAVHVALLDSPGCFHLDGSIAFLPFQCARS
jgi:hypothetical protein